MRRPIGWSLLLIGQILFFSCKFVSDTALVVLFILSIALSLSSVFWFIAYDVCKKEMERNLTETCQFPLKPKVSTVLTENLEITVKDPQGENLEIAIKGRKP